ncbi:MAG TPA: hypothetical protein PKN29_07405 [Candidatus Ozemobacteraceae bacterium]|nr:hypothetical protein [Candidatus Ozemobacteraceae bacterium]
MKPLYPARFRSADVIAQHWAELPENLQFYRHLRNVCHGFPSTVLAYAARPGLAELAAGIAEGLMTCGINVFMPPQAVPVCALSQALGARNLPIGLYLDGDAGLENLTLSALSSHGGPFDEQDVQTAPFGRGSKNGVAGETDLDRSYISNLAGLADQFIENGIGFSSLVIPFPTIEEKLRDNESLKILFQNDPSGPRAEIGPDGQSLQIFDRDGRQIAPEQVARDIAAYLVGERLASGSVLGPAGQVQGFPDSLEYIEVDGVAIDLNHRASFADLLIAWWPDGIISHQGSSCFGDAILSAIYYLEALRCRR